MNKKIATISLGCDKNRVDTEKMLFSLEKAGYELTQDSQKADILLINTCGFIEKAKKESIETILEMADIKRSSPNKKIVVTGCLTQRYGNELFDELVEVDAFVGIDGEKEIVSIIDKLYKGERLLDIERRNNCFSDGRVITTPYHYAYLKIADGCDNCCSYCAIPKIRGRYKSEKMENIISEADNLIKQGVKEIILVAQDTTLYGWDIYGKAMIKELLQELTKLDLWKVRLLYAYPERVDKELIELISNNDKIAKYIDIPLQHIDDFILKRMNRKTNSQHIKDLLKMIKEVNSDIAVRSTFIVGFNGETEERYNALKVFLENTDAIDYAGFFGYSVEEGTPASKFKESNVPKKEIAKRVKELEKLFVQKIVCNHKKHKGKEVEVIYEGIDYKKGLFFGRIQQNTPEIDTKVYLESDIPLSIGNIYKAEVIETDFNLYAKVIS